MKRMKMKMKIAKQMVTSFQMFPVHPIQGKWWLTITTTTSIIIKISIITTLMTTSQRTVYLWRMGVYRKMIDFDLVRRKHYPEKRIESSKKWWANEIQAHQHAFLMLWIVVEFQFFSIWPFYLNQTYYLFAEFSICNGNADERSGQILSWLL